MKREGKMKVLSIIIALSMVFSMFTGMATPGTVAAYEEIESGTDLWYIYGSGGNLNGAPQFWDLKAAANPTFLQENKINTTGTNKGNIDNKITISSGTKDVLFTRAVAIKFTGNYLALYGSNQLPIGPVEIRVYKEPAGGFPIGNVHILDNPVNTEKYLEKKVVCDRNASEELEYSEVVELSETATYVAYIIRPNTTMTEYNSGIYDEYMKFIGVRYGEDPNIGFRAAITKAEGIVNSYSGLDYYTKATWDELVEALVSGQELRDSGEGSQTEIEEATQDILSAIDGLEELPPDVGSCIFLPGPEGYNGSLNIENMKNKFNSIYFDGPGSEYKNPTNLNLIINAVTEENVLYGNNPGGAAYLDVVPPFDETETEGDKFDYYFIPGGQNSFKDFAFRFTGVQFSILSSSILEKSYKGGGDEWLELYAVKASNGEIVVSVNDNMKSGETDELGYRYRSKILPEDTYVVCFRIVHRYFFGVEVKTPVEEEVPLDVSALEEAIGNAEATIGNANIGTLIESYRENSVTVYAGAIESAIGDADEVLQKALAFINEEPDVDIVTQKEINNAVLALEAAIGAAQSLLEPYLDLEETITNARNSKLTLQYSLKRGYTEESYIEYSDDYEAAIDEAEEILNGQSMDIVVFDGAAQKLIADLDEAKTKLSCLLPGTDFWYADENALKIPMFFLRNTVDENKIYSTMALSENQGSIKLEGVDRDYVKANGISFKFTGNYFALYVSDLMPQNANNYRIRAYKEGLFDGNADTAPGAFAVGAYEAGKVYDASIPVRGDAGALEYLEVIVLDEVATYVVTVSSPNGFALGARVGTVNNHLESSVLNIRDEEAPLGQVVTNVAPLTDVSAFKALFQSPLWSAKVKVYDPAGVEATTGYVGTGFTVKLENNSGDKVYDSATVIIYGDINGDGMINTADILLMQSCTKGVRLDDAAFFAADIHYNGVVNTTDMVLLQNHVKGNAIDQE